jgi:transcription-repair coupling factor (superfamily II helicase)
MYCQLLEEAVDGLQNRQRLRTADVRVAIGLDGWIPRGYIPSDRRRLDAYRRAAVVETAEDAERLRADLASAYGEPPEPVERLLQVAELRALAAGAGIRSIEVHAPDMVIRCQASPPVHQALAGMQGSVRDVGGVGPDGLREVYVRPPRAFLEPASLAAVLRKRLGAARSAE